VKNIIIIKERKLNDAISVSKQIPEFENLYPKSEYKKRLVGVPHLILTAYTDDIPIGFKIGYKRNNESSFYSWMGGVLPEYRRLGVAKILADHQESWAKNKGYKTIRLKTRSKHKSMLSFSLKRGFTITARIPKEPSEESRIVLEKPLKG